MIDTNVVLDALENRQPFAEDSKELLRNCAQRFIKGCICPHSITDIFYIYRKYTKDINKTYDAIGIILKALYVVPMLGIDVIRAQESHHKDFEDALIAIAAKASKCEGIVTRNKKDFEGLDIKVYTPKEALKQFKIKK